ncbi:hypothetical protein Hypma_014694 [Hypsizygus marmoreus]|uniref:Protein kinase domain-containing protein n=1 Tax=Hypsizygus marmoreus TaxID=39966 RepID=A0A369J9D6_HYPMA|nr:hypothetical protein Hypma_014694 [Hypsizygus marmoreus]
MNSTSSYNKPLVTEADFAEELKKPVEDLQARIDLWDTPFAQNWFSQRGYLLYRGVYDQAGPTGHTTPSSSSTALEPDQTIFPNAYQGGDEIERDDIPSFSVPVDCAGNVLYAQDSDGCHVAIKLVKDNTDEYRILRLLHEHGIPNSRQDFECVIPVLELLQLKTWWFVIMPRWGDCLDRPEPSTVEEIFKLIHCLLKGLNFLHKNRIAHGDITLGNALVSHFGKYNSWDHQNGLRKKLRSMDFLTYAWMDFDVSTIFPQRYSPKDCRLPSTKSWQGKPSAFVPDTWQGEHDFDPFAYDVCSLGATLCMHFQHLTCNAPMLAPLLDRMVSQNIASRFTASQALLFFEEEVYPNTTKVQLKAMPRQRTTNQSFEDYDRWADLDSSFVKKWGIYRNPRVPRITKLIRIICRYKWGHIIVAWVRRVLHLN